VERIESIADFSSSFETIIDVFDEISEWDDPTASNKAKSLKTILTNFEFVISLHCKVSILHLFLPLSKIFQKKTIDVAYAQNLIDNLIETLKSIRANCDSEFSKIFKIVEAISKHLNIPIKIPRQTKRQVIEAM
jgi:hypothetical protein